MEMEDVRSNLIAGSVIGNTIRIMLNYAVMVCIANSNMKPLAKVFAITTIYAYDMHKAIDLVKSMELEPKI